MLKFLSILSLIFAVSFTCLSARADEATSGALVDAPDKGQALENDDGAVLQRHRPFYGAYGHELSKLQVSFKSPVVRAQPLYFGYTQVMFWALNENSKPFRDMTFNPELFYRWKLDNLGPLKSLDFGIFAHNSNGKSGLESRSYNQSYLRANFEHVYSRWITRLAVQVGDVRDFDPTNRDIEKYIGPLNIGLSFTRLFEGILDRSEFALQVQPGGKFAQHWDYGGYQASWSFRFGGMHLVPAFYLQYYRGFAETLLNYNQRVDVFRAGIIW